MHRKKKNEKLDIYTVLMLPLMTIFLLNIGLIATTWAWYTASVSTGVNEIKAGVDVSVQVFEEGSTNPIEVQNNSINLEAGKEYTFTFTPGSSANGYYALITVSNPTVATNPITNLFMTTAYADEPTSSYAVDLSPNQNDASITMCLLQKKDVSISYIWKPSNPKPSENNTITYGNQQYELVSIGQKITNEEVYTIHFIGTDISPIDEKYTVDKNEVEIEVSAPDGYYLQPGENETTPVIKRKYPVTQFSNNELTVTVVLNDEGTNNNSTADPAEEGADVDESNPENVTGNAGEQSMTSGTESATESTTPVQGLSSTPDEPTIPVQEPEQSMATTKNETNPNLTEEESTEVQNNVEASVEEGNVQAEPATDDSTEVVDDVTDEIGQ